MVQVQAALAGGALAPASLPKVSARGEDGSRHSSLCPQPTPSARRCPRSWRGFTCTPVLPRAGPVLMKGQVWRCFFHVRLVSSWGEKQTSSRFPLVLCHEFLFRTGRNKNFSRISWQSLIWGRRRSNLEVWISDGRVGFPGVSLAQRLLSVLCGSPGPICASLDPVCRSECSRVLCSAAAPTPAGIQ